MQDTKRLFVSGKRSDSFANHFYQLVPEGTQKKEVRNFVKVSVNILWQGNPMSCVKTFGTPGCKLCSKERMAILNLTRKTPHLAINKCNEVYGACRHRPRFHRFTQSRICDVNASTDESVKDERVSSPSSTSSAESKFSAFSFNDDREPEIRLLPEPKRPHDSGSSQVKPLDWTTDGIDGVRARSQMLRGRHQGININGPVQCVPPTVPLSRSIDDTGDMNHTRAVYYDV